MLGRFSRWVVVAAAVVAITGCTNKKRRSTAEADPAEDKKASTEPGVFEDKVLIGQFAVFRGPSAGLGTEVWRGAAAYLAEVNATGGVFDRKIEIVPRDDTYNPEPAVEAFKKLVNDDKVFALFNSVGTPTLYAVLPELEKSKEQKVVLLANFTGAQKQREAPFLDQIYNVRASYNQETMTSISEYVKLGHRKFGVFIQNDAYGEAGLMGVKLAIRQLNEKDPTLKLPEAVITRYERGQKFDVSNAKQVGELKAAGVEAIVAVGAYAACGGFVRDARNSGYAAPISNVSFVGPDTMLRLLNQYEKENNKKVTTNLINTQVVPSWEAVEIPIVAEYRNLVDKRNPSLPSELQDPNYRSLRYSFGALEGFVNAKVLVEAVKRAGKDITRDKFRTALQSISNWDPGIGAGVTFGANDNQGFDKVWITGAKEGSWVTVNDVKAFLQAPNGAQAKASPVPAAAKK
jgi:ABC-type branched-subunit amino acid transport system substrate-binding protein